MKIRLYRQSVALAVPAMLAGFAAHGATPDLADVRLGEQGKTITRVVLDLKGGDAPFSYSLSPDGMTVTVTLKARASRPSVPRHGTGLVRAVESARGKTSSQISIATAAPVSVVGSGKLAPNGTYRFHRIYLDLGPSGETQHPVMAAEAVTTPAAVPLPAEEPHAEMAHAEEHGHEGHEGHGEGHHGEEHHAEPVVTIKVGGSFERSVSDYSNSGGPTAALETGLLHDALELELGTTALFKDSHTTWKTGLILKKPIELTENLEFQLGAGPLWFHRAYEADDVQRDSAGVEGVAEMVFWPGEHHKFGFYVETGYSYDFGKGHEKAAGAGAGVLVPLP